MKQVWLGLLTVCLLMFPSKASTSQILNSPVYPVIFIHGLTGDATSWKTFADHLKQNGWTLGGCPRYNKARGDIETSKHKHCPPTFQQGDFYLMEFSDSSNLSLDEQAKELSRLIIAGIIAAIVILLWTKPPSLEPVAEGEDGEGKLSLSPMSKPPRATPRPFIEYPNTASTHSLIKVPSELEEQASAVLPRPLIEYSDNTLSSVLEALPSPLLALPRPLVEYANSGNVLALEQPIGADFNQVQPHPLVEYADAGWIKGLSPPLGLLPEGE